MGASHIPKKGTRTDYSLQEDQILFDWLYPFEQMPDSPISGNRIYQMLAEKVRATIREVRTRRYSSLCSFPNTHGSHGDPGILGIYAGTLVRGAVLPGRTCCTALFRWSLNGYRLHESLLQLYNLNTQRLLFHSTVFYGRSPKGSHLRELQLQLYTQ